MKRSLCERYQLGDAFHAYGRTLGVITAVLGSVGRVRVRWPGGDEVLFDVCLECGMVPEDHAGPAMKCLYEPTYFRHPGDGDGWTNERR